MNKKHLAAALLAYAGCGLAFAVAGGPNFDFLKDADRQTLQARFAKEIWPLMQRNGKEGCVGCHQLPRTGGNMKLTGELDKDFRMLVKDGFFIPGDAGSILAHVSSKDRKRRMPPPGKGDPWSKEEIDLLTKFVAAVEEKQQKKAK